MPEPKHASEKRKNCDVVGCNAEAQRSIPGKKVEKSGLKVSTDASKNAHLCKDHYREFKKKTKADRKLERMGW
jgi:hypothetical protein